MSKDQRISDYLTHIDRIHEIVEERKDFVGAPNYLSKAEEEMAKFIESFGMAGLGLLNSQGTNSSQAGSSSVSGDHDNQGTLEGKAIAGGFIVPAESSLISIVGGKVQIPSQRGRHFKSRVEMAKKSNYAGFVQLPTDKFHFVESVGGSASKQNNFAPDFADIALLIYDALVQVGYIKPGGKIQVNSGFRRGAVNGITSAHMCGAAIDIGTPRGSKDRYLIADTLWGLGLRTIAIGMGFVHVEPFGEYHWAYPGVPKYMGPGSY